MQLYHYNLVRTATPLFLALFLAACAGHSDPTLTELPAAPRPIIQPSDVDLPTPDLAAQDLGQFPRLKSERPASGNHRWSNGVGMQYEGGWANGLFEGEGTLEEPNGNRYVGEWHQGKRSGTGKQYFADGSYHEGSWELNRTAGPGTRKTADGWVISGQWNNGVVSNGLLELPSGQSYAGPLYNKQGSEVSDGFLAWLSALADRGDRYAQALLADAYTGFDKPAPDQSKRIEYLQKSADQGFAPAQYELARLFSGQTRTRWLREASERHYPPAMLALARQAHAAGERKAARQLAREAAERGLTDARRILAWWLATDPDATGADGARAETLIADIAITSGGWQYLDTLAAAQARQANFAAAVESLTAAISDASNRGEAEAVLTMLRQRRTLYTNARPWSEPVENHLEH